ncbi:MAG: hypothetical protein MJ252_05830, partial [archaeon]|nr:hypothetical protein [archaeon]
KQFVIKALEQHDSYKKEQDNLNQYYQKMLKALEKVVLDKLSENNFITINEVEAFCDTNEYLSGPQSPGKFSTSLQYKSLNYDDGGILSPKKEIQNTILCPVYNKNESPKDNLLSPIRKDTLRSSDENIEFKREVFTPSRNELRDYYTLNENGRANGNNLLSPISSRSKPQSVLFNSYTTHSMSLEHFDVKIRSEKKRRDYQKEFEEILEDYASTGNASRKFDGITVKFIKQKLKYSYNCGLNCNNYMKNAPTDTKIASHEPDSSVSISMSNMSIKH